MNLKLACIILIIGFLIESCGGRAYLSPGITTVDRHQEYALPKSFVVLVSSFSSLQDLRAACENTNAYGCTRGFETGLFRIHVYSGGTNWSTAMILLHEIEHVIFGPKHVEDRKRK